MAVNRLPTPDIKLCRILRQILLSVDHLDELVKYFDWCTW